MQLTLLNSWYFFFRANYNLSFKTSAAVLPHMRAAMSGYVMNISSTSGIRGAPCYDFYTGMWKYIYLCGNTFYFVFILNFITFLHIRNSRQFVVKGMLQIFFTNSITSSHYVGSKFALEGITDSLRYSLSPFNIAVTNINPGPVRWRLSPSSAAILNSFIWHLN